MVKPPKPFSGYNSSELLPKHYNMTTRLESLNGPDTISRVDYEFSQEQILFRQVEDSHHMCIVYTSFLSITVRCHVATGLNTSFIFTSVIKIGLNTHPIFLHTTF